MGKDFDGWLPQTTPGAAGRNAVPPSLQIFNGDNGSRARSWGAGTAKNAVKPMELQKREQPAVRVRLYATIDV